MVITSHSTVASLSLLLLTSMLALVGAVHTKLSPLASSREWSSSRQDSGSLTFVAALFPHPIACREVTNGMMRLQSSAAINQAFAPQS